MLKIHNFSRYYGYRKVLNSINLELKENEIICILGPNGAGKTTLLEGILSYHRQEKSQIFFYDKEIRSIEEHDDFLIHISYLAHEPGLFLDLTLVENLKYFRDLYSPLKKDVLKWKEIENYLKTIQLFHRKDDVVRSFSRGMKQRAGLIRCLVSKPKLLLLDEPLTGLDSKGKDFLILLLKNFKTQGSCIIVTHEDEIFESIADRFIYIHKGNIVADIPRERYTLRAKKRVREILGV